MCRNENSNVRSYTDLRTPEITRGMPANPVARSAPEIAGLIAAARLRGTAVKLAAAGRSAGVTTAKTYDVRAGTSICDSADLTSSKRSTIVRFGINAATTKQIAAGKCVNTIVFTRPTFVPRYPATG